MSTAEVCTTSRDAGDQKPRAVYDDDGSVSYRAALRALGKSQHKRVDKYFPESGSSAALRLFKRKPWAITVNKLA